MVEQQNIPNKLPPVDKDTLWVLDNYILLKDYLDRTVSRIAARCIRKGNIALEEYPFYNYILDVLEEISESGDFILAHKELYPYVEKKIAGGMQTFKKNLNDYKLELRSNSTPDMIKQDTAQELEKMKEALGSVEPDKAHDPTAGAGMSMDEVIEKLMSQQHLEAEEGSSLALSKEQNKTSNLQQPRPNQPASQQVPSSDVENKTVIKKIVKIIKPTAPQNPQAVPHKVEE